MYARLLALQTLLVALRQLGDIDVRRPDKWVRLLRELAEPREGSLVLNLSLGRGRERRWRGREEKQVMARLDEAWVDMNGRVGELVECAERMGLSSRIWSSGGAGRSKKPETRSERARAHPGRSEGRCR